MKCLNHLSLEGFEPDIILKRSLSRRIEPEYSYDLFCSRNVSLSGNVVRTSYQPSTLDLFDFFRRPEMLEWTKRVCQVGVLLSRLYVQLVWSKHKYVLYEHPL